MATPSSIPVNLNRDSYHRIQRRTRGNRNLWYQLTVLQQPERARACGSGQKANSDRRPVDPPPVVELRIIEGEHWETGKDITFDYNAHFFLYASLEDARVKSHGKMGVNNNPPILTGVPASGMAYLDRPTEAGYFIFPDLSVRHEGYYKLNFSLFETTKEEKDFDIEPANGELPPGVDWRMEIETAPFHVFSAKKFPGLMESTHLSKTVADQGCRVRIRRDVRMRKREGKSNGYSRREEKYSGHRPVTPAPEDPHSIRARSLSNSSEHRTPYSADPQRRPSIVENSYPAPPPPPSGFDNGSAPARSHLSFGGESAASQYTAPSRQYSHPQQLAPMSPTGPYPPPSQSGYVKAEPASIGFPSSRLPSVAPSPIQPGPPDSYERRSSVNYVPPSPSTFSSSEALARRDSHHSQPQTPMMAQPPSRPPTQSTYHTPIAPAPAPRSSQPAPLSISALITPHQNMQKLPPIEAQTEPLPPPVELSTGDKRKREHVFGYDQGPLYNHSRPEEISRDHPRTNWGQYYRADGVKAYVWFNDYHSEYQG
ncbi:velvet 1 [Stachybotrys elegans]|uniref:Velvet 1 n=1 Tax=Stachybotrys elegans TaxID=80388 RepID=A0A8K0SZB0_9HYPO|nr:velvet 1 [Stachybotrys elegans]